MMIAVVAGQEIGGYGGKGVQGWAVAGAVDVC